LNGFFKNISVWQSDTSKPYARAFKTRANNIEKGCNKILTPESFINKSFSTELEALSDEVYLRVRAFNQAYMEKVYVNDSNFMLYRGTDGDEGRDIVKGIIDNASRFQRGSHNITDNALAGYTSNYETANKFGASTGGLSIRQTVQMQDIILHKDLLSGINTLFLDEAEFIIKGINKQVALVDMEVCVTYDSNSKKLFGKGIEQILEFLRIF